MAIRYVLLLWLLLSASAAGAGPLHADGKALLEPESHAAPTADCPPSPGRGDSGGDDAATHRPGPHRLGQSTGSPTPRPPSATTAASRTHLRPWAHAPPA
ncbi:MAG: hypothetical protein ACOY5W_16400 [Pseudomonadota bacterium]